MSKLTNKILNQLDNSEQKKLAKLEKNYLSLQEKMITEQRKYTQYVRQTNDSSSNKAKKLADKGFEAEMKCLKFKEELINYKELLKKKYTK